MPRYTGYNPTENQSEAGTPNESPGARIYRGAGVKLARGKPTFLPGPYHFEDQVGIVLGQPYMPAPVVQFSPSFDGDVPLREAPVFTMPAPWRRKAPG